MIYLLDTSICIYTINKNPAAVIKKISSKQLEKIAISAITIAELAFGAARSLHPDRNKATLMELLIPFAILGLDQPAAFCHGRIRMSLEAGGTPIEAIDLLLASQAISRNLILVTNDKREFQRIDDLRTENWAIS
jgi:tRNA(fMet)-specific endonuclease VapC